MMIKPNDRIIELRDLVKEYFDYSNFEGGYVNLKQDTPDNIKTLYDEYKKLAIDFHEKYGQI